MKRIMAFILIGILLLSSCAGQEDVLAPSESSEDIPESSVLDSASERDEPASPPIQEAPVLDLANQSNVVTDSAIGAPMENTTALVEWVQNYRAGLSNRVTILLDGLGFPSRVYVLESDGSPTYTITEYRSVAESTASDPIVYESSVVIERAYDYVFGADISSDVRPHAVVIHHTPPAQPEEMAWDPAQSLPFHGITPADAENRAKEVHNRISRHMSVIHNIYAGGVYLKKSVLEQAEDYEAPQRLCKTVGAIRLGSHICYMIYGHPDQEALERREHSGDVTAVSIDGALVYIQSMVDGSWIFVDDANQAIYPGDWPEVETDFYTKAYAMGYTDQQLARIETALYASANTVLNLTEKGNLHTSSGNRYELDSYLLDAGGEGMTACMYLRDNQTGEVTVLPDWQNGYSSFGFLDENTFYAAIAQVGGAEYEAGVRFYRVQTPQQPFTRWDLTDNSIESESEKRLLSAYYSADNERLIVFWCEIPAAWGGWVEEDTQTYQTAIFDKEGNILLNTDTDVKLQQGNIGIVRPDCNELNQSHPQEGGVIYFAIQDETYLLDLTSGLAKPS